MRIGIVLLTGLVVLAIPAVGFASSDATMSVADRQDEPTPPQNRPEYPEQLGIIVRDETLEALELAAAEAEDARRQWEEAEREHSQVHPFFARPTMHPNKLKHS